MQQAGTLLAHRSCTVYLHTAHNSIRHVDNNDLLDSAGMIQKHTEAAGLFRWPLMLAFQSQTDAKTESSNENHPNPNTNTNINPKINLNPTNSNYYYYYYHFTTICPGLPRWVGTRRINRSGFCWSRHDGVAVASAEPYASYLHFAPEDNHASTTSLRFLRAGCPSWHPTNSVKALKAILLTLNLT